MAIVYQKDKRTGVTYAYESISYWDKEKKQSRSRRKLLGKFDPVTGEITPTDGRGKKRGFAKHVIPKNEANTPEYILQFCQLLKQYFTDDNRDIFCMISMPKDLKERISQEQNKLYTLVADVIGMYVNVTEEGAVFDSSVEFYDAYRSARPSDLTEDDYSLLKSLDFQTLPPVIRAKIADLLWTIRGDYPSANIALETYLCLYKEWFPCEDWPVCIEMMKRILCIARQINNQDTYSESLALLRKQALEINGSDTDCLSVCMLELLVHRKYGSPKDYLSILDIIIDDPTSTLTRVESAFELKKQCLKWLNDERKMNENFLNQALYYENKAKSILEETDLQNSDYATLSRIEDLLKRAIRIYRINKKTDQTKETELLLQQIQQYLPGTMQTFTVENKYNEQIDHYLTVCFKDLSFEESIIRLSQLTRLRTEGEVKDSLTKEAQSTVFLNMARQSIISPDGRTVCILKSYDETNPEKEPDEFRKLLYHKAAEIESLETLLFLAPALKMIMDKYDFSESSFEFITNNNALIPPERKTIFTFAINMALKGQIYPAVQILIPQTEHLFRCIAKDLGETITRTFKDEVTDLIDLKGIFDLPKLNKSCPEDILFTFRGLLVEHAGSNLRNDIAHGLINPDQQQSAMIYFICALLKFLVYTSCDCLLLYRNSAKLKDLPQFEAESNL